MKRLLAYLFLSTLLLFGNSTFDTIRNHYLRSYNYEQIGKYSEAIKVLLPLYKQYKNGYTLNLRLGWLFFLDKKYKDSISYYQKASLLSPYAINPRLGLARIYLATEAYHNAEAAAQRIIKIDYYNFYANLYMVKALIAQKKYDAAQAIISKMLTIYPTSVPFLEQLALVYRATGNRHVKKVYEDILTLDPNNVLARSALKQ
jgi:tetratricopeptide (TPR) repeat protein